MIGRWIAALVSAVSEWWNESIDPPLVWPEPRHHARAYEDADTPRERAEKVLSRMQCGVEYPTTRGRAVPVIAAELLAMLEAFIVDARHQDCPGCHQRDAMVAHCRLHLGTLLARCDALEQRVSAHDSPTRA